MQADAVARKNGTFRAIPLVDHKRLVPLTSSGLFQAGAAGFRGLSTLLELVPPAHDWPLGLIGSVAVQCSVRLRE